jgi:hypothetical protein
MSIIESAKAELAKSSFAEDDQSVIIDIMELFFAQWDSGGAVSVMVPVLDRLLRGMPLSGLTGEDDEWMCGHAAPGMCQNLRMGSVFKLEDGKAYDIDNPEWDGSFPYWPERKSLSCVVEFEQS